LVTLNFPSNGNQPRRPAELSLTPPPIHHQRSYLPKFCLDTLDFQAPGEHHPAQQRVTGIRDQVCHAIRLQNPIHPIPVPSTPEHLLKVEGLSVEFDPGKPTAHRAIDGVSLSIGKGEVLGLVGESGSGKTVLSHTILGLLPRNGRVTAGTVRWKGRELQHLPEKDLRPIRGKEIAMIFQDPQASLNPVYPVGRQIEWVLKLHRGITGPDAEAEILRLFDAVKLRDPKRVARSYPHELSGGMNARVMISMALAGHPDLLIADEPTSALDVSVAAEIVALLGNLRREFGLSILMITHDLGVATTLSDRIAVLDRGRAVETLSAGRFIHEASHPASEILIRASRFLGAALHARPEDATPPPRRVLRHSGACLNKLVKTQSYFENIIHTMNAIISSTGGRPGAIMLSPSHKDRLVSTVRAWLKGELSLDEARDFELCLPQHRSVALVVNNECNLSCRHCYLQIPDFAGIRLASDDWAKVIDTAVASGIEQLLVVGKEALVGTTGPRVLAKLAETRAKHPNLRTGLITNGHFLHKHWDLLESGTLSHLDLSMEGDEEDHDAIRGTGSYAAVRDNLKTAADLLGERLFVTMTVQKRSLARLDKALLAFAGLGVRSVAFAPYKALPYTDQSLDLSDADLRGFFAGLKNLGELPLPHEMLIQVDACAACPEVMTQFVSSDWFDLDSMVANGSGSLYLNRRLRNGLILSFRFQPWPLAFDYHARIALDGSIICSEDAYRPRSYAANRLANIRDFDFDFAKASRAASENTRLAAIDLRYETQTAPAVRQAFANRVPSAFSVVEEFGLPAGRALETVTV